MSFWGSKTIIEQQGIHNIISPFDSDQVKYGRYQLKVGSEVFVTVDDVKKHINENEQISIAPGQFAIILTEEKVTIPHDAIGFISIRYGIKLRGLVNVSGFHVDPGFSGKLKFAVYNAGPRPIALTRGEPAFLIWFSRMNGHDDGDTYNGSHNHQDQISSDDINNLHGKVASPSALNDLIESTRKEFDKKLDEVKTEYDKRITSAEHSVTVWRTIIMGVLGALALMFIKSAFENSSQKSSEVKNEVKNVIQSQVSSAVNSRLNNVKVPNKALSR